MSYISAKSLKDAGSSVYVELFTDAVDYTSGTTTTLTMSEPLPAENSVWVYFDGVVQHHSEYSVAGYTIIFTSAIPLATDNVEIQFSKEVSAGVPGQNVVTHSMLTDNNVTTLLRKNAVINGNFDLWQRGTSQTAIGYGSDDRWDNDQIGSTKTHSQQTFTLGQTDVPNNPEYYSRTVVSSVAGAGNYVLKFQKIEDVRTFAGETITISFWAKADANKNIALECIQQFGAGGTPSTQVNFGSTTISLTTTWQKYTTTITVPSISGKILGTDNTDNFAIIFWLEAGTDWDSRTNFLGQQSGTFDIAQVQIEQGSTATDFERRSIGDELALCQRYYYRHTAGHIYTRFAQGHMTSTSHGEFPLFFPVTMRAIPILTYSALGDMFMWSSGGNVASLTTITEYGTDTHVANVTANGAATGTLGHPAALIAENTSNAWLGFDAEL